MMIKAMTSIYTITESMMTFAFSSQALLCVCASLKSHSCLTYLACFVGGSESKLNVTQGCVMQEHHVLSEHDV